MNFNEMMAFFVKRANVDKAPKPALQPANVNEVSKVSLPPVAPVPKSPSMTATVKQACLRYGRAMEKMGLLDKVIGWAAPKALKGAVGAGKAVGRTAVGLGKGIVKHPGVAVTGLMAPIYGMSANAAIQGSKVNTRARQLGIGIAKKTKPNHELTGF